MVCVIFLTLDPWPLTLAPPRDMHTPCDMTRLLHEDPVAGLDCTTYHVVPPLP